MKHTEEEAQTTRALRRLFDGVPEPQPLPDAALRRVKARLPIGRSQQSLIGVLRIATAGVLLGVAGGAFAHFASERVLHEPEPPVAKTAPLVEAKAAPRRARQVATPVLEPAPQPQTPELSNPTPKGVETRSPSPNSAPAKASALALEAASLADALSLLRSKGQPKAALTALEAHLRAYPSGTLRLEAELARVDALLALGKRGEARQTLERLPLTQIGRQTELRLIRAELRADDDCRAALSDFLALPSLAGLSSAFAERLLFGRAACRLRVGERALAEQDFQEYLRLFPNGRFAAQARAPH